ncbi:MAG: CDP-alcohol phosphatidyltransferase family protein [Deltaproteobacteria bacterium]|nr:CDP-alcohol phosphatidyltransferase family protein [Deltaproteobacteria bacterium]
MSDGARESTSAAAGQPGPTATWRYVIPNLLTCVSISLGLLSISQSAAGDFHGAAWSVLLCVLLDKADGTAARLLGASSSFGLQLDSLSDLITFGIAPSTLVLCAFLGPTPIASAGAIPYYRGIVYLGAFLFSICAALRLAKFNVVQEGYVDGYFFGVPTTICGALVCTYFLSTEKWGVPLFGSSDRLYLALPLLMIMLALLMVSRLPLAKIAKRRSLILNILQLVNVVLVYLFGILRIYPDYLFVVAALYLLIGLPVAWLSGIRPPRLEQQARSER